MKHEISQEIQRVRKPNYDISLLIVNRWSPRAMSGEELTDEELLPIFEAARWAPSSNNSQPWRFIIAKKNSKYWQIFFKLLFKGNQVWAKNGAALVVIISRRNHEYKEKPAKTHSFDTGAAWENLALEGTRRGLVIHAIEGFDYDKTRQTLKIPEVFQVEAMIIIGKPGRKENLPQKLQDWEEPSQRKPLNQILFSGEFGQPVSS